MWEMVHSVVCSFNETLWLWRGESQGASVAGRNECGLAILKVSIEALGVFTNISVAFYS